MWTVGSDSLTQGMGSVVWLLFGDVFTRVHSARYGIRIADSAYFVSILHHRFPTQWSFAGHSGRRFSPKLDNAHLMVI